MSVEQYRKLPSDPSLEWRFFTADVTTYTGENSTLSHAQIDEKIALFRTASTPEHQTKIYGDLVYAFLPRIQQIVVKYATPQISPEELIGEACETLYQSIHHRYDPQYEGPNKKPTFKHYFEDSLRRRLGSPLTTIDTNTPVAIPSHAQLYHTATTKAWESFSQQHGRFPTSEEWYQATEKIYSKTNEHEDTKSEFGAIKIFTDEPVISLDQDDTEVIIFDPKQDPVTAATQNETRHEVMEVVNGLPGRERKVLLRKYGLDQNGKQHTQDEIGEELGVSRGRIQQLEADIERHLRRNETLRKIAEENGYTLPPIEEQELAVAS